VPGYRGRVLTLGQVVEAVEQWYPPGTAEAWDAVGLTCGDPAEIVRSVLLAVDCVPATVEETLATPAQLLITHHPLLLTGVHGVPVTGPKGRLVHRLIRGGAAHFVAHTNADIAVGGVSEALATRLGLTRLRPLIPAGVAGPVAATGAGRLGYLTEPMTLRSFTEYVARRLPPTVAGVRAAGDPGRTVACVAVCGGAGASYAEHARAAGADVFVTADLKHHGTVEAVTERTGGTMALVDTAHWASEAPWLDVLAARLGQQFGPALQVRVSATVTDPWTVHAS
jgi:dinuclear metal center YbgI/SA1388 family protein